MVESCTIRGYRADIDPSALGRDMRGDCAGAETLDGFVRWVKAEAGVARTESMLVLRPVIGWVKIGNRSQ